MVTLKKMVKKNQEVKECVVELFQDGKCLLVINDKVVDKYQSLDSCLYSNSFVEDDTIELTLEKFESGSV